MPRRRTGRPRGRPRKLHPRHRETTRAGRRGEIDRGSEWLRARKRVATLREDTEMTPAGLLYGRGLLDRYEYDALGYVTLLLRRVAGAMGGNLSVNGLWQAMLGAATSRQSGQPLPIGDAGARDRLSRICRSLNGSRDLVLELAAERRLPPICIRAAEGRLTPHDLLQLERLRHGLDGISAPRWWAAEA